MITWPTPDPSASWTPWQLYLADTVATSETVANSVIVTIVFAALAIVFLVSIIVMLEARR